MKIRSNTLHEDEVKKTKRHYFFKEVAMSYGVDEAIMFNHILYWIASNNMNVRNKIDGRTWTYNSVEKFREYFPYWSAGQISRILRSLIKQDVLITGNYNRHKYDQTTWYALKDEKYWLTKYNPVDEIEKWTNRY